MKHILIYKNTIQHFSVPESSCQPTQRLKWKGEKKKKNKNKQSQDRKKKKFQVQIKMDSTLKKVIKTKRKIFSLQ